MSKVFEFLDRRDTTNGWGVGVLLLWSSGTVDEWSREVGGLFTLVGIYLMLRILFQRTVR